ncbi:MAG: tRNA pseudouridine(13) synthase TruD [Thermoplasmata archaeon]
MTGPIPPTATERAMGIGFFLSASVGVPARLKATPDAFRVTEISSYPLPDPEGEFTVLRILSHDWEQHELGAAIARRLGLATSSLDWAGTKDRRAVAERLVSYRGPLPRENLDLPRVEVVEAYRARDGLVLGHHYGNSFDIRLDELALPPDRATEMYRTVEKELRGAGGFPNFFGPQRFGEVRPITHEVGRWVVRGDLARAVEVYLVDRPPGGKAGVGDDARAAYAEHHDAMRALREFPSEYRFERTLLEHLARGHPPERAFRALSRDLRLLFVHAFQAYLFNLWMTRRSEQGVPFDRPVEGDRILRIGRDGTVRSQEGIPAAADNLAECAELVARGRALVAGPLVGYESPADPGVPGEILEQILRDEGVERSMFRVRAAPEVASKGAWRPALVPLPPLFVAPDGSDGVRFRFALPKGAYATVLLREFLKTTPG